MTHVPRHRWQFINNNWSGDKRDGKTALGVAIVVVVVEFMSRNRGSIGGRGIVLVVVLANNIIQPLILLLLPLPLPVPLPVILLLLLLRLLLLQPLLLPSLVRATASYQW